MTEMVLEKNPFHISPLIHGGPGITDCMPAEPVSRRDSTNIYSRLLRFRHPRGDRFVQHGPEVVQLVHLARRQVEVINYMANRRERAHSAVRRRMGPGTDGDSAGPDPCVRGPLMNLPVQIREARHVDDDASVESRQDRAPRPAAARAERPCDVLEVRIGVQTDIPAVGEQLDAIGGGSIRETLTAVF